MRARTPIAIAATAALVAVFGFGGISEAAAAGRHHHDPQPAPTMQACVTPSSTPTPVPSATVTPQPTTPASTMPGLTVTSDGYTFTRSYVDDFTKPATTGSIRSAYPNMAYYNEGQGDTSGRGKYSADRVLSVHDGTLDWTMHTENGQPYGAVVLPDAYTPHTYGYFSIRFKTTAAAGYKFVPMLWPSSDVWNDGEVDWPEANLNGTPRPASAIPGSYANGNMTFLPKTEQFAPTDTTDWHTATTVWTPQGLTFYWDTTKVATVAAPNTPTKPMRWTLQAETSTDGTTPTGTGHVLVDWAYAADLNQ